MLTPWLGPTSNRPFLIWSASSTILRLVEPATLLISSYMIKEVTERSLATKKRVLQRVYLGVIAQGLFIVCIWSLAFTRFEDFKVSLNALMLLSSAKLT